MTDTMILPSGAEISVDRPDFDACNTVDDFLEIKYALNEKIIDIEYQIDLYEAGCVQRTDPSWLPRAKASLKWAKLYRDEAQNRQGRRSQLEKQRLHAARDRSVVQVLKELLSQEDFDALIAATEALQKDQS